jgi:RNA polymerase sigma factor (TIGR02999 family)
MAEVTKAVEAPGAAAGRAAADLLPLVYDELRRLAAARMANERPDHTLDATALVHEAYLRLGSATFTSKSGFFRAAALAMQRILVDHARQRSAGKRGGGQHFPLAEGDRVQVTDPDTLLTINDALATLAASDAPAADVARLRLFAGLTVEEAGETLGVSRATAFRDWAYARAVLTVALGGATHAQIS